MRISQPRTTETKLYLRLGPTDSRRGCLDSEYLSGPRSCNLGDLLHPAPLGRDQEQRSVLQAPEHTSKATPVKCDCLQHLTTFADAHATLVGNVAVPDGVVGVDADAV